ncbi:winged helix DNA-binding domain-containing protein [Streptomyces sp. NPDC090445]|uniref:winged helix DNA-binding domain-containing protein n=1 Tax=Streptomyces sp. NPDC090445 TaxID=3365963 RepID=UPI003816F55C
MTPTPVSWNAALARRLSRQALDRPAPAVGSAGIADLAAAMMGAHAQVLSAAELSLALRLDGVTRSDVRTALWADRTLVKTFGPRGTVHLLRAADLPWWTGALAAVPGSGGGLPEPARMTPEQTDDVIAAITDALTGAELTADELTEAIVARTGPWAGDPVMPAFGTMWPRWRQALHTAAHRGVLAFGPDRGRKATYTRPQCTPQPARTALDTLVDGYLRAYGPATSRDFARWLAAPEPWTARLFRQLADRARIEEVSFESVPAWVAAGDTGFSDFPAGPPRGLRLLPYFDAYVVAGRPRERLFPGAARTRALSGGQAGNHPVLLVDGVAAGVWHQRRSGRRVVLTVEPLAPLGPRARRLLEAEAERTAAILEGRAELTVGPVTVGPHA